MPLAVPFGTPESRASVCMPLATDPRAPSLNWLGWPRTPIGTTSSFQPFVGASTVTLRVAVTGLCPAIAGAVALDFDSYVMLAVNVAL